MGTGVLVQPMVNQILLAFRWYLTVQAFGLAALPLVLWLFRHLPDRGYGVSKPLGLLLAGWAFWLLTTFGWTYNTAGGILVALALLVIAGLALHLTDRPTDRPTDPLPRHAFLAEVVFTLAFAAWCVVRAYMPRIDPAGGEKWMEIAFLNAILRSSTFPPHDPWLSGFAISYYYFGYVIVAMLARLAAVPAPIAFNLGIATLFALTCTGAFSLVYNLIAADATSLGGRLKERWAIAGGLLGLLLVAVMGNLEGLLEVLHARGIGSKALWAWLDIEGINGPPVPFSQGTWIPQGFFWWWHASRVLQDYTLWGARLEVIDEFPAFSFILGDMHPHVLGLPFVLLALALALELYLRVTHHASRMTHHESVLCNSFSGFGLGEWAVYAICLGGLGFLNTWDLPIYLFVVAAAYVLAHLHFTPHISRFTSRISRFTPHVSRFASLFITLLLSGVLLYLPFWLGFQSQAGGILPNLFNGTRLPHFLVMFGPLVFIAVAFVFREARREGVRPGIVARWIAIVWVGIAGVLVLAAGVAGALVWHSLRARFIGSSIWTALGLIALIVSAILVLFRNLRSVSNGEPPTGGAPFGVRNFVLLLMVTGAILALSVEYVYLRDVYNDRMNTVFKFYFQAWVLWGVAGAYALVDIIRRRGRVPVAIAGLLILVGLIYPLLAIPARAREYGASPTLDGAAHLANEHPDDYAAITWLNEHVSDVPVILEVPGSNYSSWVYEGRVSAHTGLPTLLGWGGHENQWRGGYVEPARREPDIERLYTSTDRAEVLTLLQKYGIQYVYVGPLERSRYPAYGLGKFAALMDVVYDTGGVTIYRFRSSSGDRP